MKTEWAFTGCSGHVRLIVTWKVCEIKQPWHTLVFTRTDSVKQTLPPYYACSFLTTVIFVILTLMK